MRIVALHGNVGQPTDWNLLEHSLGQTFDKRCLWEPGALEFAAGDILLGYSLGGRLALQAAVAAPEKFQAIIVLSAHPGLINPMARQERCVADAHWAHLAETLPWAEFLRQWDAQSVLGNGSPDRFALEQYRTAIAAGFRQWGLGVQPDLRGGLRELQCPLHWITGEEDTKFTALAATAGVGSHHMVPHAGHRLLAEPRLKDLPIWSSFATTTS